MNNTEQVLEAMKKAGKPVNATEVAKLTGLDRKDVDKAMKALKEQEKIHSPKRCLWAPT
jgi:biotin operon repressor